MKFVLYFSAIGKSILALSARESFAGARVHPRTRKRRDENRRALQKLKSGS
jgi:hypothetical protein